MSEDFTYGQQREVARVDRCAIALRQAVRRAKIAGLHVAIVSDHDDVLRLAVSRVVVPPKFKPVLGVP